MQVLSEVKQGKLLLSCFSFQTVNKSLFCGLISAIFFAVLYFLLISLFQMNPKGSAEVLFSVRKAKRL